MLHRHHVCFWRFILYELYRLLLTWCCTGCTGTGGCWCCCCCPPSWACACCPAGRGGASTGWYASAPQPRERSLWAGGRKHEGVRRSIGFWCLFQLSKGWVCCAFGVQSVLPKFPGKSNRQPCEQNNRKVSCFVRMIRELICQSLIYLCVCLRECSERKKCRSIVAYMIRKR